MKGTESSDIRELLDLQDDLTETDLEEMLIPHSAEEEPSTSTEKGIFILKNLSDVSLHKANVSS